MLGGRDVEVVEHLAQFVVDGLLANFAGVFRAKDGDAKAFSRCCMPRSLVALFEPLPQLLLRPASVRTVYFWAFTLDLRWDREGRKDRGLGWVTIHLLFDPRW